MATERRSASLIKGATGDWEVIVGLEVHAQVTSRSKLFSGASTAFGGEPNAHVSLVDAAMPGMLPVINGECVAQAVRTGLGLKARINLRSTFVAGAGSCCAQASSDIAIIPHTIFIRFLPFYRQSNKSPHPDRT